MPFGHLPRYGKKFSRMGRVSVRLYIHCLFIPCSTAGWQALRPSWLTLRPVWLDIRAVWPYIRPGRLAYRLSMMRPLDKDGKSSHSLGLCRCITRAAVLLLQRKIKSLYLENFIRQGKVTADHLMSLGDWFSMPP